MDQATLLTFLHCASGNERTTGAAVGGVNMAEICWPAGKDAEGVVESAVQLFFGLNLGEWMKRNPTSLAQVDKSRHSSGEVSIMIQQLQMFISIVESYAEMASSFDGSKVSSCRPPRVPVRTRNVPVQPARLSQRRPQPRQQQQPPEAQEQEQDKGGPSSEFSPYFEYHESSRPSPNRSRDESSYSSDEANNGGGGDESFFSDIVRSRPQRPAGDYPIGDGGEFMMGQFSDMPHGAQTYLMSHYGGQVDAEWNPDDEEAEEYNPFKGVDPNVPLVQLMCEIIVKDPQVVGAAATGNMSVDLKTGQVYYASIPDLIEIFRHFAKQFMDTEARELCEANVRQFERLARYFSTDEELEEQRRQAEESGGPKQFRLLENLEEVDSLMFCFFSNIRADPAPFALSFIIDAQNNQILERNSTVSSIVKDAILRQDEVFSSPAKKKARLEENMGGELTLRIAGAGEGEKKKAAAQRKRKQVRRNKQTAERIREVIEGLGGMTTASYILGAALYTNNDAIYEEWSKRKQNAVTGIIDPASPYCITQVFSLQNAMQQRGPDVCEAQSPVTWSRWLQQALSEPECEEALYNYTYSDGIPTSSGIYSFAFPVPKLVMYYNLDAVQGAKFLTYPLPHKVNDRKHPLVERSPEINKKLVGQGSVRDSKRALHNLDLDGDMSDSERDRLIAYQQALSTINESSNYARTALQKQVNPSDLIEVLDRVNSATALPPVITQPFNLNRLTTSSIQRMVQDLTRRTPGEGEVSHFEEMLKVSKVLSSAVTETIKRIPGRKRRAALWEAHAQTMVEMYIGECDPFRQDSDAFRAIQWCKMDKEIYSSDRRLRPTRPDPTLPAYANTIVLLNSYNYYVSKSAYPSKVTVAFLGSMSAHEHSKTMKINFSFVGNGERAKSFTVKLVAKNHVGWQEADSQDDQSGGGAEGGVSGFSHPSGKSTVMCFVRKTEAAMQTNQKYTMDHQLIYQEEVSKEDITGGGGGGGGDKGKEQSTSASEKNYRTSCESVTYRAKYDKMTGITSLVKSVMMLRVSRIECFNALPPDLEDSWYSRTLMVIFPSNKPGDADRINERMLSASLPLDFYSDGIMKTVKEQDVTRLYNEIQVFIAELYNLLEMRALEPITEGVGLIILSYLDSYIKRHGGNGLAPRQLLTIMSMARILMMVDIYSAEFLYDGGRFREGTFTERDFIKLNPLLYVTPDHVYSALGMLYPMMCTPGRTELRLSVIQYCDQQSRKLRLSCPSQEYASDVHYYVVDHLFAINSATYGDKRREENRAQHQHQSSWSNQGNNHTLHRRDGNDAAQQQQQQQQPQRPPLDMSNKNYTFYDPNYVKVLAGVTGLHEICQALTNIMVNVPDIEMVPPARTLLNTLTALQRPTIEAYPMKFCLPRDGERMDPARSFSVANLRGLRLPLLLVEPDRAQHTESIPVVKIMHGHLFVSTYFLQQDISSEDLMVRAIQDLNNHANEGPMRKVLYGDHSRVPHCNVIRVGRFVKPGDSVPTRDPELNPQAYKNLRIPNPSQLNEHVRDILMRGAINEMSPAQQRRRMELINAYRGTSALSHILRQFEKEVERQERAHDTARNHPSNRRFYEEGRRMVEEEMGREIAPGEFEDEVMLCAQMAQTQHVLLSCEQMDSSMMEIKCPLSDLARQFRAVQIDLAAEEISVQDVEYAVNHFAEWQERLKAGNSSSSPGPQEVQVPDEELARFGEWREKPVTTGFAEYDLAARGGILVKRDEQASTPGTPRTPSTPSRTDFFSDGEDEEGEAAAHMEDDDGAFNVDALSAAIQASAIREESSKVLAGMGAPELPRAPVCGGVRVMSTEIVRNEHGTAEAIVYLQYGVPQPKKRDVHRTIYSEYDMMDDEYDEYDDDMSPGNMHMDQRDQDDEDDELVRQASREQERHKRMLLQSEEVRRARGHEMQEHMVFQLTSGEHLIQTPNDLVHDMQLAPAEFSVPNPFFDKTLPVHPFFNSPYVSHWALKGNAALGLTPETEGKLNRRRLFKLHYAYSPEWLIDRANLYDPVASSYKQRSSYPDYLVNNSNKKESVAVVHTTYSGQHYRAAVGADGSGSGSGDGPLHTLMAMAVQNHHQQRRGQGQFAQPLSPSPKRGSESPGHAGRRTHSQPRPRITSPTPAPGRLYGKFPPPAFPGY